MINLCVASFILGLAAYSLIDWKTNNRSFKQYPWRYFLIWMICIVVNVIAFAATRR